MHSFHLCVVPLSNGVKHHTSAWTMGRRAITREACAVVHVRELALWKCPEKSGDVLFVAAVGGSQSDLSGLAVVLRLTCVHRCAWNATGNGPRRGPGVGLYVSTWWECG